MSQALPPRVGFPKERLADRSCPACAAATLRTFYSVVGLPADSDTRYATASAAAAATTGDVLLAQCDTCAFITNVALDATKLMAPQLNRGPAIDEGDRQLADEWIERYGLRGKTLIEVGCGQGEFLEMLCARAGARGIGFDPAVGRERSKTTEVLFVAGEFTDFAADVRGDFLFCRQGLEQSADPLQFLSRLRPAAESMPVVFETADARATLSDGAFWDIDSARAGYFTLPALVRVCQRAELEVKRSNAGPGGRLAIEAGPEPFGGQKREVPTLTELRGAAHFVRTATARINEWLTFAREARRLGHRCVIWGGGQQTLAFLTTLGIEDCFTALIETDAAEQSSYLPGTRLKLETPDALQTLRPDVIVVTGADRVADIDRQLEALGLSPRVLTLRDGSGRFAHRH